MAACAVQDYSSGRLTRSKAKLKSAPYEASSTCTGPRPRNVPTSAGKEKLLYEVPEPPAASNPSKKRKKPSGSLPARHHNVPVVNLTGDDKDTNMGSATTPKKRNTKVSDHGPGEEKRLKIFRKKAPLSYLEKLERATGQR